MELSKHNYKAQQFKNSPLFADSLCVPMDMQYVLLELPTTHHRQDKTSIVMSDVSPDTTFQELENRLISRGIYDNGRSYKILLPKLQKYPINGPFLKEEEGETIEQFKRTYGLRADNVETFYLVVDNALTKWVPLPVPNNNKYELCLMILGERRDVVSFKLEWKSKKDIVNIIVSKVNELFCIGCTV